jgi:hypothetical protein
MSRIAFGAIVSQTATKRKAQMGARQSQTLLNSSEVIACSEMPEAMGLAPGFSGLGE